MKQALIAAILLAFVLAPTASAATNQGDTYFTFAGMFERVSYDEGDSESATTVAGGLEYFVSKEISISFTLSGTWAEDVDMYGIGLGARYHFNTDSNVVPYVGGQFKYDYADWDGWGSEDGFSYGPVAGVKLFMTEYTHFFIEYQYELYGGDIDDWMDDTHRIMFGVAFKFR